LEGLLISAVAETGELHGTLALEVGAVARDIERLESKGWVLDDDDNGNEELFQSWGVVGSKESMGQRLVRLAAKRVNDEVVKVVRTVHVKLEDSLEQLGE
jgi:hypothetical protein